MRSRPRPRLGPRSPTDIDQLTLTCGWHNRYKATNPDNIHITRTTNGRHIYRLRPPKLPDLPDREPTPWIIDPKITTTSHPTNTLTRPPPHPQEHNPTHRTNHPPGAP